MKVSVLIVSWNGRDHLETCLPALEDQDDPRVEWEILVLDNGSSDGTAGWLRRTHPRVRLVESPVNLGFCRGNERLVEEARGEWLALLNNDTRPEPGWLRALVRALDASPPDVAAVSGKIVDWDAERLDFGRGVMTFDGHAFQLDFRRPLAEARVPAEGEELLFACGGNLLIKKESFVGAGGFDEDYFAYLEDVDLGWRLWAGGERVVHAPEAVVRHRSGATSDLLGTFHRGFLFERNAWLTAFKNYDDEHWPRLMPVVELAFLSRTRSLLAENNPGGETFRVDPYAGHIADTGGGGASASAPEPPLEPLNGPVTPARIVKRWRELGSKELLRRVARRLGLGPRRRTTSGRGADEPAPTITDPRTVAQVRSLSWLLENLDGASDKRAAVQARRRRPDGEIFDRFPLYLVPTYPGDEALFASEGFRTWWPGGVPVVRAVLGEVMNLES